MTSSRLLLAVLLAAGCRSKPAPGPSDAASGLGTLRIDTLPQAEVLIDGEVAGTTPFSRNLAAGDHEVVLRSESFLDHRQEIALVAGGIVEIDRVLVPEDPGDPRAFVRLAGGLEVGEVTRFRPTGRYRAAPDPPAVVPLYPRGNVRLRDLVEFRIDVEEGFAGEGRLSFRHRSRVLFETAFEPGSRSFVAPVPEDVVARVASGAIVTWGFYPDEGAPATARFRVVRDDARLAHRLERLDRRMDGQPEVVRAQMRAQLLLNRRLDTAALLEARRALDLAAGYDVPPAQALAVMQSAAERLDLRDTPLWREIEDGLDRVPSRVRRRHTRVR